MKSILFTIIILILLANVGYSEKARSYDYNQTRADSDPKFEKFKYHTLQTERQRIESALSQTKADQYMKYFEKGIDSGTGVIMIEGGENYWLEEAYTAGYHQKVSFWHDNPNESKLYEVKDRIE
ncbi:MAG: hypothetical protein KAS05_02000 [Candidatus Omnitrophica bacterium]|nr:hypothetical protein [Candidatus Omnitrophota bacterium]